MWAKMTEPPPLLTSRRSGLPPAVDGVLAKALAKRPQDRYGTCQDFADALRESLGLAPYDAGAPTILDGSHRPAGARHRVGVTGTGQLAAAQDEQHQPTKDATVMPVRSPVDDRSQQAGTAGIQRSVSAHGDISLREEIPVYGAVMSAAPWGAAVVTGGVVAVFDLGLHEIGAGYSLAALSGSLAMGAVAFFVVAAAGALWRARPSRAVRWARSNPWRFAVMPAITCAVVALALSVATGGDIDGVLSGLGMAALCTL